MSLTKLTTTCVMLALMTPEAHAADNKLTKQLKKNSSKAKSVDITTLSEKLAAQSAIEGPSPSGYTDFHRRRRYYGFSSYGSPYGGGPYDSPYGYGPYDSPYGYGPYDSPYGYDTYGNYYYYLYKRNQGLSMYTMFKNLITFSSGAQLNNAEDEFEDVTECSCFANDAKYEPECEEGARPTVATCIKDDKCHWGPGEIKECAAENKAMLEKRAGMECYYDNSFSCEYLY